MQRTREAAVRRSPVAPVQPHAVIAPVSVSPGPASAAEVLRLQRLVGNRAVQRMLTSGPVLQRFPSWSKAKNHILEGDFDRSGTPTGYHSEARPSSSHVTYGTRSDLGNGTYQKSVQGTKSGKTKKKAKQSTFFPDKVGTRKAAEADVEAAFKSAETRSDKTIQSPDEWKGIKLKSIGDTVFPEGGSELAAE